MNIAKKKEKTNKSTQIKSTTNKGTFSESDNIYYQADIGIDIDGNYHNVHLTVRGDNKGNFFWDAQVKENAQLAESVTITGAEGQSNDFSSDTLIITPSNTNINPFLQSAFAGSRVDYNRASLKANPRGAYYNNTVYLFENADESTFVHEMAHAYMDVLERLAQGGNKKARGDLAKIRNWLGKNKQRCYC